MDLLEQERLLSPERLLELSIARNQRFVMVLKSLTSMSVDLSRKLETSLQMLKLSRRKRVTSLGFMLSFLMRSMLFAELEDPEVVTAQELVTML